jgi:hypothetical protein
VGKCRSPEVFNKKNAKKVLRIPKIVKERCCPTQAILNLDATTLRDAPPFGPSVFLPR